GGFDDSVLVSDGVVGCSGVIQSVFSRIAPCFCAVGEIFGQLSCEIANPSDGVLSDLSKYLWTVGKSDGVRWKLGDYWFDDDFWGIVSQDIDFVLKERYSICHTPARIRDFILDRTLTQAFDAFGVEDIRVIDPSCGAGGFVVEAFKRLFARMKGKHKDWSAESIVHHLLDRIVGIDINECACVVARARLIMTAVQVCGLTGFSEGSKYRPRVYCFDGLDQPERDIGELDAGALAELDERPVCSFSRGEVRAVLAGVLRGRFHVVVGHPPCSTEKDVGRRNYHRQSIGCVRRYLSAVGKYSLSGPFVERYYQIADRGGYVGFVVSNGFTTLEFGRALIERVLVGVDLYLIVDLSQMRVPSFGGPAVMVFGRNRLPSSEVVPAVLGKNSCIDIGSESVDGAIWKSVSAKWHKIGYENDYISVSTLERAVLASHPWSLGGAGATELRTRLELACGLRLGVFVVNGGAASFPGTPDAFVSDRKSWLRAGISDEFVRPMIAGESVRNWSCASTVYALVAYDSDFEPIGVDALSASVLAHFWRLRTLVLSTVSFSGVTRREAGDKPWLWYRWMPERYRVAFSIAFAEVSTQNHFVLDRGGSVFTDTAPVIKLRKDASETDHFELVGLLNSSLACFWMKQVCTARGGQEGWKTRIQFSFGKLRQFPVSDERSRTIPYVDKLDDLGRRRVARSVLSLIDALGSEMSASALRDAIIGRRVADYSDLLMVIGLQEELDWLCYAIYGLDDGSDVVSVEDVEPCEITWLPWCLDFADEDRPNAEPSGWWKYHGWQPCSEIPSCVSDKLRVRIENRRRRAAITRGIGLIENCNYKRGWEMPSYEEDEYCALSGWLADMVEGAAMTCTLAFTVVDIVSILSTDSRVQAVCEVMGDSDQHAIGSRFAAILDGNSLPNHRFHVFKPSGLEKLDAWERTWAEQIREDLGEKIAPMVPPAFDVTDFHRRDFYRHRGKLNIPRERFIVFTEDSMHRRSLPLYGWAGWTAVQRINVILAIEKERAGAGVLIGDRIGLLDSAWRLLGDVVRDDPELGAQARFDIEARVGSGGPSERQLSDWMQRFPPRSRRGWQKK
ncbi:MAG: BREX-2 system adenine-specific DNA-methyltransferase PglX, partial [Polyangiaceae bacterium]|nr:BREX-2 system adenine-specific DNA-methyltransferase PglX [Polyangiaceae bacterium]